MTLVEASRLAAKYQRAGYRVDYTSDFSGQGYLLMAVRAGNKQAPPLYAYTEGHLALLIQSGQVAEQWTLT